MNKKPKNQTRGQLRQDIIVLIAAFLVVIRTVPDLALGFWFENSTLSSVLAVGIVLAFWGAALWFALRWCGPRPDEEETDESKPKRDPYWFDIH